MERAFKGIWIPAEILHDEKLNITEKIYLSILKMDLDIKTNNEMAKFIGISNSRLSEIKKMLVIKGYLAYKELTPEQKLEAMLSYKNTGKICEWCGCKTIALQEHHYPIQKKDGGIEIVKICPNCHYEFHHVEQMVVIINE